MQLHPESTPVFFTNAFTSPVSIRPIEFGADIVINSLTKFMNGHSDAMAGSISSTKVICDKIHPFTMLLGTPCDSFTARLVQRGIETAALRIPYQMQSAANLAMQFPRYAPTLGGLHTTVSHPVTSSHFKRTG